MTSSGLLWGKPHPRKDLKPRHCTQPEKPQAAGVGALQPPPLKVLHGVYRARAPLNAAGWGFVMLCLTFGAQFWVSTGQDRGSSDPHDLMSAQGGEKPPHSPATGPRAASRVTEGACRLEGGPAPKPLG